MISTIPFDQGPEITNTFKYRDIPGEILTRRNGAWPLHYIWSDQGGQVPWELSEKPDSCIFTSIFMDQASLDKLKKYECPRIICSFSLSNA